MAYRICQIPGCTKLSDGYHRYCAMHKSRFLRHGDFSTVLARGSNKGWNKNRKCEVEGCAEKHVGMGMCRKHYDAMFRLARKTLTFTPPKR